MKILSISTVNARHVDGESSFGVRFDVKRHRDAAVVGVAWDGALNEGSAVDTVQAYVGEFYGIASDCGGSLFSAALAFFAAHFEYVRKVGVEFKRELDVHGSLAVVVHGDLVVADGFRKELGSIDVDGATGKERSVLKIQIRIREVSCEKDVVFADG